MLKRFSALMLCACISFLCLVSPAHAIVVDVGLEDVGGFFDWVIQKGVDAGGAIGSIFKDDICPYNPSSNKRHEFVSQHTMVGDKTGYFYVCKYCNKTAGEVGEEAYQQQVSDLPAPVYGSDGSIYVLPTILFYNISDSICICTLVNGGTYSSEFYSASANLPFLRLEFLKNLYVGSDSKIYGIMLNYDIPFLCSAELLFSSASYSSGIESGNLSFYGGYLGSNYYGTSQNYAANSEFSALLRTDSVRLVRDGSYVLAGSYVQFILRDLRLKLTPHSSSGFDTVYNVNTRPTTITGGNYGIVGDDNQITTVNDNRKIVNEGDNIYYNPATGQTQNITDWSYDYSSRIYNITLDTGDKVSVEYGDENISIVENKVVEGDTIVNNYTIYYMIDGSGDNPDPTPGPTSCPHDWQAGSTVDPTCTVPGKTVYTCSKCGETKTEILPALGHDWQVVRTVPTEYDEDGNQIQAGYTLYECSRCGNQYKDEDSTGPPGDDVDDGGLLAWLNGLIKHLSDNLSGVVALIKRFFTEIPELFSGFTAFLAAVFPFLPDEIILLLTFGMAALVVVGVIKAIRR